MISRYYVQAKPYIKNFLPLFFKNIVFVFLGLFQLYILTKYLDTESYGKLQFILTIISTFVFFSLTGSNLAYNKMGARNDLKYYFPILIHKIKFSLLGSVSLIFISLFYLNKDMEMFYGLFLSALFFPLFYSIDGYLSLLNGQEKFHQKVKYEIIKQLIVVFILICTVIFITRDILTLLFILFLATIIFNIIANLFIFKKKNLKYLKINKFKDYKKYTNSMSWISIIGVLEGRLDRLIVGSFFGFTNLAVYHVAKTLQEQIKNIWVMFSNLIIPKTYKNTKEKNIKYLTKITFLSIFIFTLISIIIYFIAPIIFNLFDNDLYLESQKYFNVMLLNIIIGIPSAVLIIYFNTYSYIKDIIIIKIASFIIYLILLVYMSYKYQIIGIIYANMIRIICINLLTIFLFKKKERGL